MPGFQYDEEPPDVDYVECPVCGEWGFTHMHEDEDAEYEKWRDSWT